MTKFKFFRGYVGTLDLMGGQTYATASLYYPRLDSNNEMERWYAEHDRRVEDLGNQGIITHEQYMRNRDMMIEQERIRRLQMINNSRDLNDNPIRLYQATRVTTVNPKWWMKIKMAFQETWLSDPVGVVVITTLVTIVTFIGIMKLLGA